MDYKKLCKKEKFLILDLIELSMGGNEEAKEQLESIIGVDEKHWDAMQKITKSFTESEKQEDLNRTKARLTSPIPIKPVWGGKREGSGRPTTGRKKHQYYVTDKEAEQIKKLIDDLRKSSE